MEDILKMLEDIKKRHPEIYRHIIGLIKATFVLR